jgi:tripartite-type tricarboxylate transporter receptor subunit TctC
MKSFADFSARAKTDRNPISVGSAGNGSTQHLALELLALKMGVKLNHIPYKGSGPALVDVIGGQVDTMMDQLTASLQHIKSGALIPLAQTGKTRSPLLPNVPTFEELGVKDFDMMTYTGIFGPKGMPQPVVDKLSKALKDTLERDSVKERFTALGVEIIPMDRAAFQEYVKKDYDTNKEIGKAANIVLNQ